jgi:hypothetical protein
LTVRMFLLGRMGKDALDMFGCAPREAVGKG